MTIFRLNFLLKVGQMKVCQNPSFISTTFFQPNSAQKHDFRCKMISPLFPLKSTNFIKKKKKIPPQRRNFPHSGKIWSGIFFSQKKKKKCPTLKMKSTAIPPNLSEKLIPPGKFLKIHEWNISKKSSAKIRGKTNFHSKILNFTNLKFFPKFHLLKSHGKKSEIFAKPPAGKSTATSTPFSII